MLVAYVHIKPRKIMMRNCRIITTRAEDNEIYVTQIFKEDTDLYWV